MKETLQYIFSSFWVFLGVVVLIVLVFEGIADIIKASNKPKQ